jgi:uncharacterized protein with GYD domain
LNQEETDMPHFVSLIRYTHQGISKIKESPSRLDAAKKAAEKEGGKIQAWYLTMGQYDAVLISEFPSDEACAKFTLSAGALGNISTETLKAFPEAEYRQNRRIAFLSRSDYQEVMAARSSGGSFF